ncbi:uncharacterized protein FOMMEDRAFT_155240 [Fomitiporia mediterranea MF3/22]|uniref:uncharacterized protein n=1 Tax=Fomitiporia mediterranea (strain MF3/22) TaxID=694068 RepID=UPI0004407E97|nr:uncharacterized protein FOMMEDRAFT_155240 [Fomitiporia mediterranea MF3/22]EJD04112.1 hypothetical protein FOMMEDRAFT_155240 [Fomitiporia mediterranea MF3/22]
MIADQHVAPWLTYIAFLCDGLASDNGDIIVTKIETRIGGSFTLPEDGQSGTSPKLGAKRVKLAVFWDEMKQRSSRKKVYGKERAVIVMYQHCTHLDAKENGR